VKNKDPVSCCGVRFHFELTPLVLSSIFFAPKIVFSVYGSEETSLPMYCMIDNAGPDRAIFWISLAVVILQRQKVVRCVQFYWIRAYFSIIKWRLQKKMLCRVKTVHWEYRLSILVARLGQIWVQKFIKFDLQQETVPTR